MNVIRLRKTAYKYGVLLIVIAVMTDYIVLNFSGTHIIKGALLYWLHTLFWLVMGLYLLHLPKPRIHTKNRYRAFFIRWSFALGLFYIVVSVIAGFFVGFGSSPYNFSPVGILHNLVSVSAILFGRELVRNYFINNFSGKNHLPLYILIALFMAIIEISPNKFLNIIDFQGGVIFFAESLIPLFCLNLLAGYLVYLSGPLSSITYLGTIKIFQWFCPVLPNLNWLTSAFIGILVPIFSLIFIRSLFREEIRDRRGRNKEEDNPVELLVFAIISVAILWFSAGVFPVYPSIIATGSMEPLIDPGDIILVHKIKADTPLKTGDIIQFRRNDVLISHRIVNVVDQEGVVAYQTKGDANFAPDIDLVQIGEIKGIVGKVIPKIGVPALLFKDRKYIE